MKRVYALSTGLHERGVSLSLMIILFSASLRLTSKGDGDLVGLLDGLGGGAPGQSRRRSQEEREEICQHTITLQKSI